MHDLDHTLHLAEGEAAEADAFGELEAGDGDGELESPFDEGAELELALELLGVADDAELEQFLGKLLKKAKGRFKKALPALGRVLKPLAKQLLPIAGRAVGTYFGGPLGGALGGQLGGFASRLFGEAELLELEGLEPEERELEVARRFVRLAGAAAFRAAALPPSLPPQTAARKALAAAARRHAPGLLQGRRPAQLRARGPAGRSGRWIRRGRRIVLLGA